jgi:hypothetical protein
MKTSNSFTTDMAISFNNSLDSDTSISSIEEGKTKHEQTRLRIGRARVSEFI